MIAIIAVNNLGFIGFANKIPWKCNADLQHFKAMTMGKTMLVGYNTYQGLPGVVKAREINIDVRSSFYALTKNTICIGGKKTYEKYCYQFTELHISKINDNTIGDCLFPNLSELNPDCKIFVYNFEIDGPKMLDLTGEQINSITSKI